MVFRSALQDTAENSEVVPTGTANDRSCVQETVLGKWGNGEDPVAGAPNKQWELFGGSRSPCSSVGRRLLWLPCPPCLVPENVICENQWGRVDTRHGADPILRNNLIFYGYLDSMVVGECGKGLIEGDAIHGKETTGRGCGGCPGGGCGWCPGGGRQWWVPSTGWW